MAPPLLQSIYTSERANYHQGDYISASLISGTNCPRQVVLERTTEYYELAERKYWAFRGTVAHSVLERGADEARKQGWLQELRMQVPIKYPDLPQPLFDADGRWTGTFDHDTPLVINLAGTCDLYNPLLPNAPLWDFKSMKDKKMYEMAAGTKGGEYCTSVSDKWFWQIQIYRWLIAKTRIPADVKAELGIKGVRYPEPRWVGVQGISMAGAVRTGITVDLPGSYGGTERYDVAEVPIVPLKQVEAFIRPRLLRWYRWLTLGMQAPITQEKWLCKTCCFNGERVEGGVCFPTQERAQTKEPK
jgi:hypothetical protein